MIETTAAPFATTRSRVAVDRQLRGIDLIVILATAFASLIFTFFGAAASGAIYALVVVATGGSTDPTLLETDKNLLQTSITVGAIYGTAVLPLGIWSIVQLRGLDRPALGLRGARYWWFAIALGALAVLLGYDFVSVHYLDPDGTIRTKLQKTLLIRSDSLAWTLTLWVIVAPITALAEELLYRGLLYRWFRERLPLWLAILASALIFGLIHGSWISPGGWMGVSMAVALTLFGINAALLLEGSGSLWPSIFMHFVNNSLFVLGAYHPDGG